ncbi:hypothetical protein [Flavobacterium rhizosphaerae]|uniref:Uncharacterized protein n=1 Tax=Flavobacterium rhizosphaerae TaxID=3163298 RepID=A0ABW8YS90_9FLAO
MKLNNRIYWYFWITSFLIFVYGLALLIWSSNSKIVVNFKDIYYVADRFQITMLFKVVYLLLGLLYWIGFRLKLRLNPTLTKIHTYISIGGVAANALLMVVELIRENTLGTIQNSILQQYTLYILLLVLIAQPLFIINFGVGILKGRGSR